MNANELIAELEERHLQGCIYQEAATMLRQQQAEIEAFKKEAALQRLSDFTQEADNEPVAWAYIKNGEFWDAIHPDEHAKEEGSYDIPLYTHLVKTLTDEEILNEWIDEDNIVNFARAILKKAQEK